MPLKRFSGGFEPIEVWCMTSVYPSVTLFSVKMLVSMLKQLDLLHSQIWTDHSLHELQQGFYVFLYHLYTFVFQLFFYIVSCECS